MVAETIRSILETKGSQVWSLTPDATVYDAIALMAEKGIGALPVVSEGRLVGILSERDYARKVILKGKASNETLVREIMTCEVISATPDHTVDECMRMMTNHRIRHLPVFEADDLVGIVSIGDLVKAVISSQGATINNLSNYIVGKYPA